MIDRLDRSFDRNTIALILAGPAALVAFVAVAVVVDQPTSNGPWSLTVGDAVGGLVFHAWFLLPLPFVLIFGIEWLLLRRRISLLTLPAAAVHAMGAALGVLTMFVLSWTLFPGEAARVALFGGAMGLASAVTIVLLRDPRVAS